MKGVLHWKSQQGCGSFLQPQCFRLNVAPLSHTCCLLWIMVRESWLPCQQQYCGSLYLYNLVMWSTAVWSFISSWLRDKRDAQLSSATDSWDRRGRKRSDCATQWWFFHSIFDQSLCYLFPKEIPLVNIKWITSCLQFVLVHRVAQWQYCGQNMENIWVKMSK